MTATLEQELAEVLQASRLAPRQARAVSRRFGWDGLPPATLAEAGAGEGYTRERVRQLEQRARRHAAGLHLPLATAALRLVDDAAPAPRGEVARGLALAGIAEQPFDPAGILVAAELTGVPTRLAIHSDLVIGRHDAGRVTRTTAVARKLARRHGAVNVQEVARQVRTTQEIVRRVLGVVEGSAWLGDGWVALPVARDRATTGMRKMLSVASGLTFADVEDGLRRPGCDVWLPRRVLAALCRSLDWVDVETGVVASSVPLDMRQVLSPIERSLVDIFRSEGHVLGFTRALQLAEAAGLKTTSAAIYLGKTPVLRTVSRGVYALRGHGAAA